MSIFTIATGVCLGIILLFAITALTAAVIGTRSPRRQLYDAATAARLQEEILRSRQRDAMVLDPPERRQ